MRFSSPFRVACIVPTASSLIWLPFWCKASSSNHEALLYEVPYAGFARILSESALLIVCRCEFLDPYNARSKISSLYYEWIFKNLLVVTQHQKCSARKVEAFRNFLTDVCYKHLPFGMSYTGGIIVIGSAGSCTGGVLVTGSVLYRRRLSHRQCPVQAEA
jgi:hypothetical protein